MTPFGILEDEEIRLIWQTCVDWIAEIKREHEEFASTGRRPRGRVDRIPTVAYITQLMFFTGCRISEISGLRREEIVRGLDPSHNDGELWIPGTRRKARKKHEDKLFLHVPLAHGAVEILRQIALHLPVGSKHIFGKGAATRLRGKIDERIKDAGKTPPPDWHPHDIRRTFRSRLSQLKPSIPEHIKEKLVGHLEKDKNKSVYDQYEYWGELTEAIDKWEHHLGEVLAGTAAEPTRPQHRRTQ
jgi:integrase